MARDPLRVANCSGFYGDRLAAAREMLEGGPIDVLTGEYLAELTMLILWKARQRDSSVGYATTFLRQMEDVLGLALEREVKIVANAGGLNPRGLADQVRALLNQLGLTGRVAHIEGDDLIPRLKEMQAVGEEFVHLDSGRTLAEADIEPVSANAYLGAWGICEALSAGADIVICPRVTDASLVVGPAAWHFGWARDDWDCLAGAVVAGHIVECGPQTTGGNYSFFREVPGMTRLGFPIAEIHADGSSVITKHPSHGGRVSIGTVTAQLLYEIQEPRYLNPDVVAQFDTITLAADGPDRVSVSGVKGEPAPDKLKVSINYVGGYRNEMTFVLTGLDIEAKAAIAKDALFESLGGVEAFDNVSVELIRSDRDDSMTNEGATAQLRVTVKDRDQKKVGRAFSNRFTELALSSYPGFFTTTPPQSESLYGVFWPSLVAASEVAETVVLDDGTRLPVEPPPRQRPSDPSPVPEPAEAYRSSTGIDVRAPLGLCFGARSGDKGGNANVGVWARSDAGYRWLQMFLTVDRFKALVPEAQSLEVKRYLLPNLRSLNFVVLGLLDEGVASSTRHDRQAKGLGEYLRSRTVEMPVELTEDADPSLAAIYIAN